jgi:SAM-dependent methyltransferase
LTAPLVFDAAHYDRLNASRAAVVSQILKDLRNTLQLRSAIDVGCGAGYFTGLLSSSGLNVTAVDGRSENVEEAGKRYEGARFCRFDAEDPALLSLGKFDLCFCFGLLYHLENPFLAIRHLKALTGTILLVEGVIFPGDEPVMALIDEEPLQDQGLHHFAFYPTEACLIKMFYRAGFSNVYALTSQPRHPEYEARAEARRVRTILAASEQPINSTWFKPMREPASKIRPWDPSSGHAGTPVVNKLQRFVRKPLSEKIETLKRVVKPSK